MPPTIKVRSSRRTTGRGAMTRIRTDFRSGSTRTRSAVRHCRISGTGSWRAGCISLPFDLQVSSIVTIGSGRPYNVLAGDDLNGDGDGGTFPPDRARTDSGRSGVERRAQRGQDADAGDGGRAGGAPVHARTGVRRTGCSKCSTCSTGRTTRRSTTSSAPAHIRPRACRPSGSSRRPGRRCKCSSRRA